MTSTSALIRQAEAESTFEGLTWPDYIVIAAYFIFVLVVGLIVSDFAVMLDPQVFLSYSKQQLIKLSWARQKWYCNNHINESCKG